MAASDEQPSRPSPDPALAGLTGIAAYFRIPADPVHLAREIALGERAAVGEDIVRAASLVGLRGRILRDASPRRLARIPIPALARTTAGGYVVLGGAMPSGLYRTIDPLSRIDQERSIEEVSADLDGEIVLVQRRLGGPGLDPQAFSVAWFVPSLWRYRRALVHVVLASLVIQLFALVTPLFFQVVIDKVLVHRSASTLYVLVVGLVVVHLFDTGLQYLRSYALNHTTNRIDVELGQRLFAHLLRLPVSYFETRAAGQTVARMREPF